MRISPMLDRYIPHRIPLRPEPGPDWTGIALGAVAGFVAGVALDPGRRLAIVGSERLAGDWFEILKAEHKAVDAAFGLLLRTTEQQPLRRAAILKHIGWALYKHGLQEEAAVYPAMRHTRAEDFRELNADHAEIKAFLYDLWRTPRDDRRWLTILTGLHELIQNHVREEEDQMFPDFRATLSKGENAALTRRMLYEGLKIA